MKCSHVDVVEVKVLDGYKLYLKFSDGGAGEVDISRLVPFKGVFEPLKDIKYFSTVVVNRDIGTICWESGADISPSLLREKIK